MCEEKEMPCAEDPNPWRIFEDNARVMPKGEFAALVERAKEDQKPAPAIEPKTKERYWREKMSMPTPRRDWHHSSFP
jgi:hypothetical protein